MPLHYDERVAAWRLQRPLPVGEAARTARIPTSAVARILGRRVPLGKAGGWCVLYGKDDTIWSGNRRLWKTGTRQVMDYLLAHITENDLDHLDQYEWALWVGLCRQQRRIVAAQQPAFYRSGIEFVPAWQPGELAALRRELANGGSNARNSV